MASQSLIMDALAALQSGDRRRAAMLLRKELARGAHAVKRLASIAKLADKIGEIELSLAASKAMARSEPVTLNNILAYCGALAQYGRSEDALAVIKGLPTDAQNHPAILHFIGVTASEIGNFEESEAALRRALAVTDGAPQAWFALTMIKTFVPGDPDFDRMAAIEPQIAGVDPHLLARYYYGMGKALDDMGESDRAFSYYAKGAAVRRKEEPYDRQRHERQAEALIRNFRPGEEWGLTPSRFGRQRAIFVNGLPRSGTTMVESMLVSHSAVSDGAEINLLQAALLPTLDYSMDGARAYQGRHRRKDPFGELAEDYHRMLQARFGSGGLVVDKTLSQSWTMGLLLHTMPDARVVWLRRRAEDVALSAYRTYFTSPVSWSWSLEDIAHQMKLEDRLHAHWTEVFPQSILTLPYEELVADPGGWIPRILDHVGLAQEDQVRDFHRNTRKVRTASVKQVRAPISTSAVGKSDRYLQQLAPFIKAYRG